MAFSVTGFRNPISSATVSGFTVRTQTNIGGGIDSGSPTVQVTTPASITSASLSVHSSVNIAIAGVV